MTAPTQNSVVAELLALSRMLDKATAEVAEFDEEAVRAKHAHELAHASTYIAVKGGTVNDREQRTRLAVADYKLDKELAEAKLRACQERIRTLRAQLEVRRSLNAAVRTEWTTQGAQQGGQA